MRELTYRYRIYPAAQQIIKIRRTCGCGRFLYNQLLTDRTRTYRETQHWAKMDAEPYMKLHFMQQVDPAAMQHAVASLERAFKHFFYIERTKRDKYRPESIQRSREEVDYLLMDTDLVSYPRLKKKKTSKESYTTVLESFSVCNNRFVLPMIGLVKIKYHRPIPEEAKIKTATILKKASGKYFVLLRLELPEIPEIQTFSKPLGVVYAQGHLAVRSDAVAINYRLQDENLTRKIKKAYQDLKRKRPGSARYEKQRKYLASLYEYRVNQRRDDMHKAARQITNAGDLFYLQKPDVTRQLFKTVSKRRKALILDEGWWTFSSILESKIKGEGKRIWCVTRQWPVYKLCSECNALNQNPDPGRWVCPACKCEMDRDLNAACNLRNLGRKYIWDLAQEALQ